MTADGKIKVGIVGAAGYTAGELLRILVNHPHAEVVFAQSASHAGEPLWFAHADLLGETDLCFCDSFGGALACETTATLGTLRGGTVNEVNGGTERSEAVEQSRTPSNGKPDVLFVCSGHGKSKDFVHSLPSSYQGTIIDLSNDFRLKADAEDFVYGLPEAFREKIQGAKHIANPGCFATAIQLALLPMAKADLLPEIHVTGITGSTGAGQAPSATTHFSWRSDNLSIYKAFTHQHLGEIKETLHALAPGFGGEINFVPVRGDFARGILASVYFDCPLSEDEAVSRYNGYYAAEPFVHVIGSDPDLKMVVTTNKCVLNVRKHGSKLHVISVIDNLVKGASGQAVQNMNLIFGLPEYTGLHLKANRY